MERTKFQAYANVLSLAICICPAIEIRVMEPYQPP